MKIFVMTVLVTLAVNVLPPIVKGNVEAGLRETEDSVGGAAWRYDTLQAKGTIGYTRRADLPTAGVGPAAAHYSPLHGKPEAPKDPKAETPGKEVPGQTVPVEPGQHDPNGCDQQPVCKP